MEPDIFDPVALSPMSINANQKTMFEMDVNDDSKEEIDTMNENLNEQETTDGRGAPSNRKTVFGIDRYTGKQIRENTGRWTKDEHAAFLEALKKFGKDWKNIATQIDTRTVVQVRTHAQKYFQRMNKQNVRRQTETSGSTTKTKRKKAAKSRSASMDIQSDIPPPKKRALRDSRPKSPGIPPVSSSYKSAVPPFSFSDPSSLTHSNHRSFSAMGNYSSSSDFDLSSSLPFDSAMSGLAPSSCKSPVAAPLMLDLDAEELNPFGESAMEGVPSDDDGNFSPGSHFEDLDSMAVSPSRSPVHRPWDRPDQLLLPPATKRFNKLKNKSVDEPARICNFTENFHHPPILFPAREKMLDMMDSSFTMSHFSSSY
eukprot:TRINITY_DN4497_c0_g1_i1.p1 TRINITY_DN4497_c0_g1~~TRINITY_DN4497_c0_g1_i1.p1  ORF type:complete len:369 (+),score=98.86 TRINITY_DN4497_c0_g1_i1:49-1155(+)